MCGRYLLHAEIEEILKHYGITTEWTNEKPSSEVFPSHKVPVVVNQNKRELVLMKWGFTAPYGKGLIINSRGETVHSKPMFRRAFQQKRCIVPANAFFEWSRAGREKVKYRFRLKQSSLFSLAGIYEDFRDQEGMPCTAFSILTIQPNSLVSLVHDRMPVILPREQEGVWLDHTIRDMSLLQSLLQPYDETEMVMEPVI
ncbi:MAG: SOS response-associated peptidase [Caldicoprobacterales bacterium]|jgi:putative SOS response-associated peptidase YedK|nr:SOS response-associated peptidase [Clostridiales bacterium]